MTSVQSQLLAAEIKKNGPIHPAGPVYIGCVAHSAVKFLSGGVIAGVEGSDYERRRTSTKSRFIKFVTRSFGCGEYASAQDRAKKHIYRICQTPIFIGIAAVCLTPMVTPAIALAIGAVLALSLGNPFQKRTSSVSKYLLQGCVVLLGFGMNLPVVLKAGASGAVMAAGTIAITFLLGSWIGGKLGIARKISALIFAGTAICGGSAIAAVGSVIGVAEGEITVAMGTVFLLNAVGLYLFPPIGHVLHMSQTQFGTWAGVAIHDISSVVGAASRFGLPALQTAIAVKLSRALWIIPVSAAAAIFRGEAGAPRKPMQIPWFIGLFLLASVARSIFVPVAACAPTLSYLATRGLTFTLFLVGAGLSATTLRAVGVRPLIQGLVLWMFISVVSLVVILKFQA